MCVFVIDLEIKSRLMASEKKVVWYRKNWAAQVAGNWRGILITHENHMVVHTEVPISRISCVSQEANEIMDAAVKNKCDPRLHHKRSYERRCFNALRWGTSGTLGQITLQHQSLPFPKEEFKCENRSLKRGAWLSSRVKGKQQTSPSHTEPQC